MVVITDELLAESQMTDDEARLEIACRLFAAGKWTFPAASRWAGLCRRDFEQALVDRDLPIVRLDDDSLEQDLKTLCHLQDRGVI